jgi:hypothetical protein
VDWASLYGTKLFAQGGSWFGGGSEACPHYFLGFAAWTSLPGLRYCGGSILLIPCPAIGLLLELLAAGIVGCWNCQIFLTLG